MSKHIQLSIFSRHLNLILPTNQQKNEYNCYSLSQESGIYILQTINVDKKLYFLFYDTVCCDMVSRYDAVKSMGSRAVQESSMLMSISVVDNSLIKPNHRIFQV